VLRPSPSKPPRQHANGHHILTSLIIVIHHPIRRQAVNPLLYQAASAYCGLADIKVRTFNEANTLLGTPHQAFPVRSIAISAPIVPILPFKRPPHQLCSRFAHDTHEKTAGLPAAENTIHASTRPTPGGDARRPALRSSATPRHQVRGPPWSACLIHRC